MKVHYASTHKKGHIRAAENCLFLAANLFNRIFDDNNRVNFD